MKERKLNYRFHDPNPPGEVSQLLLQIFVEANKSKVEQALQEAAKSDQQRESV